MTQDNTAPGPIFKARLLHVNKSAGPAQGVVGKILSTAFRKRADWYWIRRYLMRSNRALQIDPGGVVLSSVIYGKNPRSLAMQQATSPDRPMLCPALNLCSFLSFPNSGGMAPAPTRNPDADRYMQSQKQARPTPPSPPRARETSINNF